MVVTVPILCNRGAHLKALNIFGDALLRQSAVSAAALSTQRFLMKRFKVKSEDLGESEDWVDN